MALQNSKNSSKKIKDTSTMSLINIIEACVENLSNMNTIISKAKLNTSNIKDIVKIVNSSIAIIEILVKNEKLIQQFSRIKVSYDKKNIDNSIGLLKLVIEDTSELINSLSTIKFSTLLGINLTLNLMVVTMIRLVIKMIELSNFMMIISPAHPIIVFGLRLISAELVELNKVYDELNKIDALKVIIKIPIISLSLKLIQTLMWRLTRLQEDPAVIKLAIAACMELAIGMKTINFLFKQIATTKVRFIQWKLRTIIKCITLIRLLLIKLTLLRVNPKLLIKITILNIIMLELKKVFISIALLGLFAIPALLLMPVTILMLLGVVLLVKIIGLIRISPRSIMSVIILSLVVTGLVVIALSLLAITLIAKLISIKALLTFFGALLIAILLIAAISLASIIIAPIAPFVLISLAAVALIVTALLIIAVELLLLEKIDLNADKIKTNVDIVIGTALDIVTKVMDSTAESFAPSKPKDSSFTRFLKKILGGVGVVLELILAVPILLMTTITTATILFIAVALRLLQIIVLDPKRIMNNVNIVIKTAKSITSLIFAKQDKLETDNSNNESWKSKAVNFMKGALGGITNIIETIFAVAILAMTVISVTLILIIATELRILQTIELDPDRIYSNVDRVIDTAKYINYRIIHGADGQEEDRGDKRSFVRDIIKFFGGALGGIVTIIDSILAVGVLAMAVLSVSIIFGIANMLNRLQDIKLNESVIIAKVNTVISCANRIRKIVFHQEEKAEEPKKKGGFLSRAWGAIKSTGKAVVGVVKGVIDGIGNLGASAVLASAVLSTSELLNIAETLNSIGQINIQREIIENKVVDIINVSKFVGSQVSNSTVGTIDGKKVRAFKSYVNSIKSLIRATSFIRSRKMRGLQDSLFSVISTNSRIAIDNNKVDSFHSYAEDSVKLMSQINKLDADKLVKYSDMWAKMTEFMQEIKDLNIEELSDAIVNKIAPAMSDISDNVDSMSKAKPNNETQITNPPSDSGKPVVASVADNNNANKPKMSDPTRILEDIKSLLVDYFESRG